MCTYDGCETIISFYEKHTLLEERSILCSFAMYGADKYFQCQMLTPTEWVPEIELCGCNVKQMPQINSKYVYVTNHLCFKMSYQT